MRDVYIIFMQRERDDSAEFWWRNEPWVHKVFGDGASAYEHLEAIGFIEEFETCGDGHIEPTGNWRRELPENHALYLDGQVLTDGIIAWVQREVVCDGYRYGIDPRGIERAYRDFEASVEEQGGFNYGEASIIGEFIRFIEEGRFYLDPRDND